MQIDGRRLWNSLMSLARIGALPKGGVGRLALSDEDAAARRLFMQWCTEAGCSIRLDRIGNIFARRAGQDSAAPAVLVGSHLDTQPTGGKFDGALGVMAGLEVIRSLNDARLTTRAPVEVAVWTNEEGARFAPIMLGSAVAAGALPLQDALARADPQGLRVGDELRRIGFAGPDAPSLDGIGQAFELHIEQGPILEQEGITIGAVLGVQGLRWLDVEIVGAEAHAGSTPMTARRDALLAAARFRVALDALARAIGPDARATVGVQRCLPGSRNTVPGRVELSVDIRHPDDGQLTYFAGEVAQLAEDLAREEGVTIGIEPVASLDATRFDPGLIALVREAAASAGHRARDIYSGAGHDSVHVARKVPTAMIFIPCTQGISHNEAEDAHPDHVAAGCDVLYRAVVACAGV